MPFVTFSGFAIVLSVTHLVPLDSPGGQKRCQGQCQDLAARTRADIQQLQSWLSQRQEPGSPNVVCSCRCKGQ